jgi:predicted RNA binding protein with dsRBD fold (UPF0201 family)
MEIRVICPIYPTEDSGTVLQAMKHFFDDIIPCEDTTSFPTRMVCELKGSDSISLLRSRIHNLRIIDAVRSRLLDKWNGYESCLLIDKQAAVAGKLRLVDDSEEMPPLGAIELLVGFDDRLEFERMLRWFVPPTVDGRVIEG